MGREKHGGVRAGSPPSESVFFLVLNPNFPQFSRFHRVGRSTPQALPSQRILCLATPRKGWENGGKERQIGQMTHLRAAPGARPAAAGGGERGAPPGRPLLPTSRAPSPPDSCASRSGHVPWRSRPGPAPASFIFCFFSRFCFVLSLSIGPCVLWPPRRPRADMYLGQKNPDW